MTTHKRKCWDCKTVNEHVSDVTPGVLCPRCGSQDTRKVNPPRQIYLAARYSRRLELCGYRDRLRELGFVVQARWLDGDHQISDTGTPLRDSGGEALVEGDDNSQSGRAAQLRSKFAEDDFSDVSTCDILIAFTEPPRSGHSRGGRHVELGIALALRKHVIVVGPRENIFCWMDRVQSFDDAEGLLIQFTEHHRLSKVN